MTKIAVTADLHESLPDIKNVDMAIFCGDFCLRQRGDYLAEATVWYTRLIPYLKELRRRNISLIGCPGNHDFACQSPDLFKQISTYFDVFEYEGHREFNNFHFMFMAHNKLDEWAFYRPEEEIRDICDYYKLAYKNASFKYDFLITHTGPDDVLSCEDWGIKPIGDLAKALKPKHFHAFGHIHSRFGMVQRDGITYVNSSYCKEGYSPRNKYPIYDTETKSWNLIECEDM